MNLADAFRYYRNRPIPGHVIHGRKQPNFAGQSYAMPDDGIGAAVWALKKAREAVAAHKAAKAHYETCAAIRDARREESNAAKKAAQFLARDGGPKYEAAAQAVTVAVGELSAAERAYNAALKALTKTRLYTPSPASLTWQPGKPGFAYVEKPESFGLRYIGRVTPESYGGRDTWDSRESCGWFTDPHGDVYRDGAGLVWGVVYQLPARDGKARFVAGYQFGGCDDGPTLDFGDIFEGERGDNCSYDGARGNPAARDAARAADSMAQRAAEREREYQTAWALGNLYAEKAQEAADARKAALALLAERRAVKGKAESPAICRAIRDSVAGHIETIREARDAMRDALNGDGPHGLCVYMDSEAKAAFCEGAGLKAFPA